MTLGQVVINRHPMAGIEQLLNTNRADVARASGHKHIHGRNLSWNTSFAKLHPASCTEKTAACTTLGKRTGLLPLLPSTRHAMRPSQRGEERAGERRAVLLTNHVPVSSWMPLSPPIPHGERESALSCILPSLTHKGFDKVGDKVDFLGQAV